MKEKKKMLNISLISKDKGRVSHQIWGYLFEPDATVISELAIYRVGKPIEIFCFITSKVFAKE